MNAKAQRSRTGLRYGKAAPRTATVRHDEAVHRNGETKQRTVSRGNGMTAHYSATAKPIAAPHSNGIASNGEV